MNYFNIKNSSGVPGYIGFTMPSSCTQTFPKIEEVNFLAEVSSYIILVKYEEL